MECMKTVNSFDRFVQQFIILMCPRVSVCPMRDCYCRHHELYLRRTCMPYDCVFCTLCQFWFRVSRLIALCDQALSSCVQLCHHGRCYRCKLTQFGCLWRCFSSFLPVPSATSSLAVLIFALLKPSCVLFELIMFCSRKLLNLFWLLVKPHYRSWLVDLQDYVALVLQKITFLG